MTKIIFTSLILISIFSEIFSQALPIAVDGRFTDWEDASANFTDNSGDGNNIDLLSFSVANDSAYLYIKLELADEMLLNSGNQLFLELDTDNDPNTGYAVNGIGAELGLNFGGRYAYFNTSSGTYTASQNDIELIALPTVTSNIFEIAIGRNTVPDGIHPLFTSETIKICFADQSSGGDYMPNIGTQFSYVFDNSDVGEYPYISLDKDESEYVRLMTYNTLYDGLTDNSRADAFERIISAVNPDIITFNECWDTQWYEAKDLLNTWLPLPNSESWTCYKIDGGNITCSKFPISENWRILYDRRMTASLVNLPASYPSDILVVNSHFACCDDNTTRQREADAFVSFIKDAKSSGGVIDLPYGTPFVLSGDLNLVGYSQQLTTLITGDIIDTGTFGEPLPPDWDETNLNDVVALQTDRRTAYTWRDSESSYWPGRLDYTICSDIGMFVKKTFTLDTETMSAERLNEYNLLQNDTYTASDHLPKITDFLISEYANRNTYTENKTEYKIYPNPAANGKFNLYFYKPNKIKSVSIFDVLGRCVYTNNNINNSLLNIDFEKQTKAMYFIYIKTENKIFYDKVLIR